MIATKSLAEGFASFQEPWSPRVAGDINDMQIKLVKLQGAFVWHSHDVEDELFLVISGRLRMEFRDQDPQIVGAGEFITGRWPRSRARWCCSSPARRSTRATSTRSRRSGAWNACEAGAMPVEHPGPPQRRWAWPGSPASGCGTRSADPCVTPPPRIALRRPSASYRDRLTRTDEKDPNAGLHDGLLAEVRAATRGVRQAVRPRSAVESTHPGSLHDRGLQDSQIVVFAGAGEVRQSLRPGFGRAEYANLARTETA